MSVDNRRKSHQSPINSTAVPQTETDAALNAGEALATLRLTGQALRVVEGGRPYRITENGTVESLEGFLPAPVSTRADVEVYDAASFLAYVNRFADEGSTIFGDKVANKFTAVLDYHVPTAARWGRHRIGLALRPTRQWQLWMAHHRKPMNQAAFAQFLEDNIPDIAEPDGADLVEIARTLQGKKSVVWESNILRQTDGSYRFVYAEDVQGTTHREDLKIPDQFKLVLQPIEGAEPVAVDARFRFRVEEGGKLSLWFDLVRPEDILERAFEDTRTQIGGGLVKPLILLAGPAPAASRAE